ncbi:cell adhesion molecule 2-like isoform X2 [Oreochromis aureus]|uniref:cell adhesion molecule 2-like isoform X2 n=1 Tax=Oreochromis aureus TaxID=47969 RepID=UPI001953E363|nr:cell adhesion molecule 2-like isoform X2 [Oreochromis aureus]
MERKGQTSRSTSSISQPFSVSSGTLVVTQSPDDISVMEGATVNITCCWTVTFGRVGVNWLKNQTVIKNEVKQNQSQGSLKEETKMCSSLNFSNIQTKDSGTYICKVTLEIPSLFEAKGNGTVITVREKTENDNGNSNRKESGVSSGTLVVTQSPDDISVMEGATVNITCCWPGKFGRVGVNWLKNQTVIKNEVKQNQSQGSLKEETKMCSSLNFSNIQTKDSGTYICKVTLEIPSLFEAKGNGTVITVREKTENDNGNSTRKESDFGEAPTKVIISLAVVVPLLLTTLVCYCTLRRKQALAARVIYEVPHVDSDVAEMDKHSTNSSLGSSQWRQVPLYESFYFEHVDPKESE